MTAAALLRTKADLLAHDGEVVSVVGKYKSIDTRPHANLRREPDGTVIETFLLVRLRLEDGTLIVLGARPDAEIAAFDRKMVVVTGTLEVNPPLAQGMAQPTPQPTLRSVSSVAPSTEPPA